MAVRHKKCLASLTNDGGEVVQLLSVPSVSQMKDKVTKQRTAQLANSSTYFIFS